MSKIPNIIQRRELDPLMLKASNIIKHYKKAANCAVTLMKPDGDTGSVLFCPLCKQCALQKTQNGERACHPIHMEAVKEARILGGSNIYLCPYSLIFWASPFYAGERFAGALISGGIPKTVKNSNRVKALANMLLIYAEKISSISYIQKNITMKTEFNNRHPDHDITSGVGTEINQIIDNNVCSTDMERILLASLRRGDNVEAREKLRMLLNTQYQEVRHNLPAFRLKAIELVVLLSRAVSDHYEINNNTILETNNRYLELIEKSQDFNGITEILISFIENISEKIFSFQGVRHFSAIRKAERFIWENYTRKISLREIAGVSGLSAPYFSTIFKEEMGENLSNFINRLRVEKAATVLINSNMPISEISKNCGFEDQSWFSKIFKGYTGLTPGKYRDRGMDSGGMDAAAWIPKNVFPVYQLRRQFNIDAGYVKTGNFHERKKKQPAI